MRKDLANKLRCPVTGEPLTLHAMWETEEEISYGLLKSSAHTYPIVDGVAELLPPLDQKTQHERDVREGIKHNWEKERQRPYLNDHPTNPSKWPSRAANAEQGMAQTTLKDRFVLDLGAATGWSTRMLCERGAQAVALDISTHVLRDAKAQFATGVYFDRIAATMTHLPFNDAVFDVVFSSASVHHADSLLLACQEISRVLKPGGYTILTSEPVLGLLNRPENFGRASVEFGMNEHIYRLGDYLRALRAAGLTPRVLFPADLQKQLDGAIPVPTRLMRSMQSIWRWIPKLLRRYTLLPGHWLVGFSLALVAEKR